MSAKPDQPYSGKMGFAVAQAVNGFAMAALFGATGESHAAIFAAGLGFSAAALLVAGADRRRPDAGRAG